MKNKIKTFVKYVESIGGKHEGNWTKYSFLVETIYGPLRVSIWEGDFTKQGKPKTLSNKRNNFFSSIFTSFQDFEKAREFLKVQSPGDIYVSHKWNFHLSGGSSAEQNWDWNFENFKSRLDKILLTNVG